MHRRLILACALALTACGEPAPNPYPASAKAHFDTTCRPEDPVCQCTWEALTRAMTYEEYEAALARFREAGRMDPRVTRTRTQCIERNPG